MRRIFIYLILLPFVFCSCQKDKKSTIDLSGVWKFQIDSLDLGIKEQWFNQQLEDEILLPGSMATNGKGAPPTLKTKWTGEIVDKSFFSAPKYAKYRTDENFKIPFWLQPNTHYLGAAWYQKEIEIANHWAAQTISLLLERCHWETQVWVDNKKAGIQNSLGTPHQYNLTSLLTPGKHTLTIRVDNRIKAIDVGANAHSVSDHTQSNWNGIAGAIKLIATPRISIKKVEVHPNVNTKKAIVTVWIENDTKLQKEIVLDFSAESFNTEIKQNITSRPHIQKVDAGVTKLSINLDMGEDVLLWDEFTPNLYCLTLFLKSDAGTQKKQLNFGMREFKPNGTRFEVNGKPLFLRGTLESSIFPKTGYPSTNVEDWIRIFKICKTHGLNHVRFHSHCPPEAAFEAADRVGIYLQAECGSWTTVGDGKPIDKWLYKEADRMLEAYGNHPSFCMMAYGNEPSGANQASYLSEFVAYLKNKDSRRVYTGAAGWPYLENNDFFNNANPRIQGWGQGLNSIINKDAPKTSYDFKEIVEKVNMPYISHEIGQWCVYPNFKEIKKYTGVLKPKNFEIFQETLEENNLGYLADSLLLASGKLQALCYKADIEAALRTPGFAGFQLLDLHDFPGQGSALVGVLDPFWEEKGYITAEEFSQFCNQTVPLARLKTHTFLNTQVFNADIEVAHFGSTPMESPNIKWTITNMEGKQIKEGVFSVKQLNIDNCQKVGHITMPLHDIKDASQFRLNVFVNEYSNHWDFWVYPKSANAKEKDIHITNALDKEALKILNNGGKVLWSLKQGDLSSTYGGDIEVGFSSIFWNTAWTRKQPPHTLGILCNPKHDALKDFPTEYHSNWQWWDAMKHGQAIILDNFSEPIQPIVRIVDDWFENRSLGLIFEAKVGNGKLIVSGVDLISDLNERLEAQQLLYSLKNYMNSDKFNPEFFINVEALKLLSNQH
jgi:hypothetical protein